MTIRMMLVSRVELGFQGVDTYHQETPSGPVNAGHNGAIFWRPCNMAYVSIIADLIGVISSVYIFIIGTKGYLTKRKQEPDAAHKNETQSRPVGRTGDES